MWLPIVPPVRVQTRAMPPAEAPRAHPARAATPMAFVHAVLRAYEKYGVGPAGALRHAGIGADELHRPGACITAAQMERVCGHAMQELDDEALGWFARRLPWGSYGMLCRASLGSPDLGVALRRWCRHHRLLTEDIVLSLAVADGRATIAVAERRDLGALREFCLLTSLRYLHGYACWAIDSRIAPVEAAFPFAPPPHRAVYPLLFPGQVRFGAAQAGLSFDAAYLALPLRRDEAALRAMLVRALPLTVLQYRRDRLLVQRVREALRSQPATRAGADALAEALHLSKRSLHRHLRDEGATLQGLKDEVRRAEATRLLACTARPVKRVAREVGFDSEKSFARAFRGWTGMSPSEYRRSVPAPDAPAPQPPAACPRHAAPS